jgi:hypothetical protein
MKLDRLPFPEARKTSPLSWKDYPAFKLERLPLLEAGKITSPGSMEGLPLLEAGKITSPGSME